MTATDTSAPVCDPNDIGTAALAVAVSKLGVTEVGGNNRGPDVEAFLASVGLAAGYPWCASFVFWCFRQAAQQLGVVNPCPRTGGALRLWSLADAVTHTQTPGPGRIYVLDHGRGVGHAGIIESVNDDGTVSEISGNTNKDGSREGNAVWRHTGDLVKLHGGTLVGFVDLARAVTRPLVA